MKIIGHRGVAGIALENSPESIRAALALDLAAIEIDARLTKDGHLVVIHDGHTGSVADKKLTVADSTLAELKALRLKNGERLLALDEALMLIGNKKPVIIDLKTGGLDKAVTPVIKKHSKMNITLTSRRHAQLGRLHKTFPDLPFTPRSYFYTTDIVHIAHNMGASGISVNKWLMNPLTYHLAKRAGLEVHTYTVNNPFLVRLFSKLYPDIYIVTNYPNRFVGKVRAHK